MSGSTESKAGYLNFCIERNHDKVIDQEASASERLDPGQDATHVLDADFPVEALKAKKLKEIRLDLSYIPSAYKEETLNFTVSIGGQ